MVVYYENEQIYEDTEIAILYALFFDIHVLWWPVVTANRRACYLEGFHISLDSAEYQYPVVCHVTCKILVLFSGVSLSRVNLLQPPKSN